MNDMIMNDGIQEVGDLNKLFGDVKEQLEKNQVLRQVFCTKCGILITGGHLLPEKGLVCHNCFLDKV